MGALVVGLVRQGHIDRENKNIMDLNEYKRSNKDLMNRYHALEAAHRSLESRIVGESKTVKTLYEASVELERMDIDSVFKGLLKMLEEHFSVKRASIYTKDDKYYVLKASLGWKDSEKVEGKGIVGESIIDLSFEKNKTITVRDVIRMDTSGKYSSEHGKVMAMMPIRDEKGEPVGTLNIENIDFLAFTSPNLKLIELIIEWVGRVMVNKKLYDKVSSQTVEDDVLKIYKYSYFEKIFPIEFDRAKTFSLILTATVIKIPDFGFLNSNIQQMLLKTSSKMMRKHFSDTDIICKYKIDGIFLIICPMKKTQEVINSVESINNSLKEMEESFSALDKIPQMEAVSVEYNNEFINFDEMKHKFYEKGKII